MKADSYKERISKSDKEGVISEGGANGEWMPELDDDSEGAGEIVGAEEFLWRARGVI